jgi:hypothetical protein
MGKYIITAVILGGLTILSGTQTFAHGPASIEKTSGSRTEIMRYIEDAALGEEVHEEMEELMTKMMAGSLNETEAKRIIELMNEHPGPHGMMMNRMGMGAAMMSPSQGIGIQEENSMMNDFGLNSVGMMGIGGGLAIGYWITILLLWLFLVLGSAAFWKWIMKSK